MFVFSPKLWHLFHLLYFSRDETGNHTNFMFVLWLLTITILIRIEITESIQWMQEIYYYCSPTNSHQLWRSGWLNLYLFLAKKRGRSLCKSGQLYSRWNSVPSVIVSALFKINKEFEEGSKSLSRKIGMQFCDDY